MIPQTPTTQTTPTLGCQVSGSRKSPQNQITRQNSANQKNQSKHEKLNGIKLSLKILKEAREYAALYLCLVMPDAGRRQSTKRKAEVSDLKTRESLNHLSDDGRVKEIMASMQPRQAVKRKTNLSHNSTKVSVLTTVEPEDCFWPISITQEFNFDQLFEGDDVEDELKLGPMTLSAKVSTTVVMERGGSVNRATSDFDFTPSTASACYGNEEEEDFGFLGK